MTRYILKRLLNMIPIVGGVTLLTFVLFNVIGGSPAAVVLGKNASARALEEFDEQRGYNKPLLFGRWTRTRAFPDAELNENAGPWRGVSGVSHGGNVAKSGGYVDLPPGERLALPVLFSLPEDTVCRWVFLCRAPGGCTFELGHSNVTSIARAELPPSDQWRTVTLDVPGAGGGAAPGVGLHAVGGALHLRAVRLRRRTRGPLDSQLFFYLGQLARFDFGTSSQTNQKVTTILAEGVLPSLSLTVPIFTGGLLLALCLALICAYYRDRPPDRILVVMATALMSVNYIVWVVGGQFILSYRLGWFPIWGYESWRYLLLPVMIGIVSGLGRDLRFYRTVMLDEMYRDYVRTAEAKGVPPHRVLFRHVLRNSLIPVVTNVSMAVPFLFTGSLLLESFFGIPGLGSVSINAIHSADMDVVRAVVLIGSLLYVVVNLLTDLCYAVVDPRVRLE